MTNNLTMKFTVFAGLVLATSGCASSPNPQTRRLPSPTDTIMAMRADVERRHRESDYEVPRAQQMPLILFTPSLAGSLHKYMERTQQRDRQVLQWFWHQLTGANAASVNATEVPLPSIKPGVRQLRVDQWGVHPSPSPCPDDTPVPRYHVVQDFLLVYSRTDRAWRIAGMRSEISNETFKWQNGKTVRGWTKWSLDLVPFLKNALQNGAP